MLVFWKQRLVFLAVPKTGSTAYAEALGGIADLVVRDPPELRHAPLYRYNRFFRPMFEKQGAPDMQTVAVMREPVDWLASWYRYRSRTALQGQRNSTAEMSFDAFVTASLAEKPPGFADVGSQAHFLAPRPNGTRIGHLFRYDDLGALDAFLTARLGCALDLPRINVSPDRPVPLSPQTEHALRQARARDFALYASIPKGGLHAATAAPVP